VLHTRVVSRAEVFLGAELGPNAELTNKSIKDVRTQGWGDLSSADIFRTREGSSSDASALFEKLRIFRNLWCPHWQGGKGVNFSRFCAEILYGRPL